VFGGIGYAELMLLLFVFAIILLFAVGPKLR